MNTHEHPSGIHSFTFVMVTALLTSLSHVSLCWAQNGFDTSDSLISRSAIRSGGPAKDGIPALTSPVSGPAAIGDTYLKPEDLVVGVNLGGEARAYPLRILVWHEVANDVVGGVPVAVTYCPLCGSSLVFNRKVAGEVREFGVSGLLYNSNVLLYDRQKDAPGESLWSQAEMRAVTGPAAKDGLKLALLPSDVVPWADWRVRHPETTVLSLETGHSRNYRGTAYASYFDHDRLMFPVKERSKKPQRFRNKEPLAVVYAGASARAYSPNDVAKAVGEGGVLNDRLGNREIRIRHVEGNSLCVEASDGGPPLPVAYLFWFALSASQPEVEIFEP